MATLHLPARRKVKDAVEFEPRPFQLDAAR